MAKNDGLGPVHPGAVLRDELSELEMSARALAQVIKVPVNRVTAILNGERGITADTARRLGRYFGTSTEFWMNLQRDFEMRKAEIDDTTNLLNEIVPRQTVLLRDAVSDIHVVSSFSSATEKTLKTIASNLTLCTQLQKFEQSSRIGELTDEWMRAFAGPLNEIREKGVFETQLSEHLPSTLKSLSNYENRFKSPSVLEYKRLKDELAKRTNIAFDRPHLMLKHLDCAWLNERNEMESIQRLVNLQYMGNSVLKGRAFSSQCTESLRKLLGDWREEITWPTSIWEDLDARVSFYATLGFDAKLTNVPSPAFQEILDVSEIKSEPPDLIETYGPIFQSPRNPDEERALARTNKAHDWLQRLESQLRRFIDCEMARAFGSNWIYQKLPKKTVERWKRRQKSSEKMRTSTKPLVSYADFSDYELIVCHRDRWDQVFAPLFASRENVRESFQRLYPIRNDTMHGRPITQDDELLLYVETKRLMNVIDAEIQTDA